MNRRKDVPCAYCGVTTTPSREHALADWASEEMAGYLRIGTVMAVHKKGQEPTIFDVCRDCNHGVLGPLDEAAKKWWVASEKATKPIIPASQGMLARWLGKVAYNVQRIEKRERGSIGGPPVSDPMRAWITGQARPEGQVTVWASVFPEN